MATEKNIEYSRKQVDCTYEFDGDDPFYIREFHISMWPYM